MSNGDKLSKMKSSDEADESSSVHLEDLPSSNKAKDKLNKKEYLLKKIVMNIVNVFSYSD